jgi:hypothetical protein
LSLKNKVDGFLGLGLKTGSYGLVIWATKKLRRFLNLGLKTKWAMVCWLCHKTNGRMKTVRDTGRDLAAFGLNHIQSCATMFFIFVIIGGIFGLIFDLVI